MEFIQSLVDGLQGYMRNTEYTTKLMIIIGLLLNINLILNIMLRKPTRKAWNNMVDRFALCLLVAIDVLEICRQLAYFYGWVGLTFQIFCNLIIVWDTSYGLVLLFLSVRNLLFIYSKPSTLRTILLFIFGACLIIIAIASAVYIHYWLADGYMAAHGICLFTNLSEWNNRNVVFVNFVTICLPALVFFVLPSLFIFDMDMDSKTVEEDCGIAGRLLAHLTFPFIAYLGLVSNCLEKRKKERKPCCSCFPCFKCFKCCKFESSTLFLLAMWVVHVLSKLVGIYPFLLLVQPSMMINLNALILAGRPLLFTLVYTLNNPVAEFLVVKIYSIPKIAANLVCCSASKLEESEELCCGCNILCKLGSCISSGLNVVSCGLCTVACFSKKMCNILFLLVIVLASAACALQVPGIGDRLGGSSFPGFGGVPNSNNHDKGIDHNDDGEAGGGVIGWVIGAVLLGLFVGGIIGWIIGWCVRGVFGGIMGLWVGMVGGVVFGMIVALLIGLVGRGGIGGVGGGTGVRGGPNNNNLDKHFDYNDDKEEKKEEKEEKEEEKCDCKFPYLYKGKPYQGCTTDGCGTFACYEPWCATEVDVETRVMKQWTPCKKTCKRDCPRCNEKCGRIEGFEIADDSIFSSTNSANSYEECKSFYNGVCSLAGFNSSCNAFSFSGQRRIKRSPRNKRDNSCKSGENQWKKKKNADGNKCPDTNAKEIQDGLSRKIEFVVPKGMHIIENDKFIKIETSGLLDGETDNNKLYKFALDLIKKSLNQDTRCIYIGVNCLHKDFATQFEKVHNKQYIGGDLTEYQLGKLFAGMLSSRWDNAKYMRHLHKVEAIVAVRSKEANIGCQLGKSSIKLLIYMGIHNLFVIALVVTYPKYAYFFY